MANPTVKLITLLLAAALLGDCAATQANTKNPDPASTARFTSFVESVTGRPVEYGQRASISSIPSIERTRPDRGTVFERGKARPVGWVERRENPAGTLLVVYFTGQRSPRAVRTIRDAGLANGYVIWGGSKTEQ